LRAILLDSLPFSTSLEVFLYTSPSLLKKVLYNILNSGIEYYIP